MNNSTSLSGLKTISSRTFHRHQRKFLVPAINEVWEQKQQEQMETARADGDPLILGGDGRADSPGHSAKFGTYSTMDLERNKVINVELVQVCIRLN
jgi:solute carrier family 8 (sodium/calcium exchanger)